MSAFDTKNILLLTHLYAFIIKSSMDKYGYIEIYKDKNILAVQKNHGIYVIPDRKNTVTPLIDILRQDYGEIYITHRLDAGTGGLMVFARNKYAHRYLSMQFEKSAVDKCYIAITEHNIFAQSLMLPIAKANHGKFNINFKSGKPAVTSFFPLSANANGALILAKPKTGRTHQIRLHLKALKAPLYKDFLYNKKTDDKRLTLQCLSMRFLNPENEKHIFLKSNITEFMLHYINLLELSEKSVYQYNHESR